VLHEGRLVAHGSPAEVLTPEAIGRWWGVEADVEADDAGRVSVTVRRRGRTGPSVTEPITGAVTGALAATESAAPGPRVQEPT